MASLSFRYPERQCHVDLNSNQHSQADHFLSPCGHKTAKTTKQTGSKGPREKRRAGGGHPPQGKSIRRPAALRSWGTACQTLTSNSPKFMQQSPAFFLNSIFWQFYQPPLPPRGRRAVRQACPKAPCQFFFISNFQSDFWSHFLCKKCENVATRVPNGSQTGAQSRPWAAFFGFRRTSVFEQHCGGFGVFYGLGPLRNVPKRIQKAVAASSLQKIDLKSTFC